MKKEDLKALLERKIRDAMNAEGSEVSKVREENYDVFMGKPYPNDGSEAMKFKSKFITREGLEAVEWTIPSVFRVLFADGRPVAFSAFGKEDEALAFQETDILNHMVMEESFLPLYEIFKQACIDPTAYGMISLRDQNHDEVEEYKDVPEADLYALLSDEGVEVEDIERFEKQYDPLASVPEAMSLRMNPAEGAPPPPPIVTMPCYNVKIRRKIQNTKICLEGIPPEEMLVDKNLSSLDLDEAVFVARRQRKLVSDLVEAGLGPKKKILDAARPTFAEEHFEGSETINRRFFTDEEVIGDDEDPEYAIVHEIYARVDYDDDGYAELRRILMIGHEIFENEETSLMPFVAFSISPIPHRHIGMSLIDIVKDIQRLSTELTRQMLNSLYSTNRNRVFANERAIDNPTTMQALMNGESQLVPIDGSPHDSIMFDQRQSLAGEILPVMQALDVRRRTRTGVAPDMALDPEVVKRSTASAYAGADDQRSVRLEMIVRIFCETGLKKLVLKAHQALRMSGVSEIARKIRGEWVSSNPSLWRKRTDVVINVGVGHNSRQQKVDMLMQVLALQEKAAASGIGLVGPHEIYRAFEALIEAAGVGHASTFMKDPHSPTWQPPEPAPSPDMILAQAEQAKVQAQSQLDQMKMQIEMQREQMRMQLEQQKAMLETEREQAKIQAEQQKFEFEERKYEMQTLLEDQEMKLKKIAGVADALLKREQAIYTRSQAEALGIDASEAVRAADEVLEEARMLLDEGEQEQETDANPN